MESLKEQLNPIDMKSKSDNVNLFWTGGWDSTFRLLQVLVTEHKSVQTYYIIDPNRPSFQVELATMEKIRKDIVDMYPETEILFSPTIIVHLLDIKKDQTIEVAYEKAQKKEHLGSQYDWLARFCNQYQIMDMEVCVQKLDTPNHPPRFSPFFERDNGTSKFVYKGTLMDEPEYILFKNFRFPILNLTKEAMFEIAKGNHWLKIMNKTWFCHSPFRDEIPCGKCVPCKQIINDDKLKRRIPIYIRLIRRYPSSKFMKFIEAKLLS